jgi:hypothetical protein
LRYLVVSLSILAASMVFGDPGGWGQIRGQKGSDIALGGDGSVWLAGKDARPAGHSIYLWAGGNQWQHITGQAIAMSVDPDGAPWVANMQGDVYRFRK